MIDGFDLDVFCAQADNLADELLAALEDPCKGIDESLYNVLYRLVGFGE